MEIQQSPQWGGCTLFHDHSGKNMRKIFRNRGFSRVRVGGRLLPSTVYFDDWLQCVDGDPADFFTLRRAVIMGISLGKYIVQRRGRNVWVWDANAEVVLVLTEKSRHSFISELGETCRLIKMSAQGTK
jgi:hypothetical protein